MREQLHRSQVEVERREMEVSFFSLFVVKKLFNKLKEMFFYIDVTYIVMKMLFCWTFILPQNITLN